MGGKRLKFQRATVNISKSRKTGCAIKANNGRSLPRHALPVQLETGVQLVFAYEGGGAYGFQAYSLPALGNAEAELETQKYFNTGVPLL